MADYCAWCGDYCGQRLYYTMDGVKMGWFCSSRCVAECPYGCGHNQGADCFITTAICDILGKADDCVELETLRGFRDTYMMEDDQRRALVDLYYEEAPAIAQTLRESPDKNAKAEALLRDFITPAVKAVEAEQREDAMAIYTAMMSHFGVKG